MAWETRNGSSSYYYKARKVNGRVVKEYFGAGKLAQAVAGLDRLDREEAAEQAEEQRQERERLDALDGAVEEFCRDVDTVMHDALTQAGYHRHARGQWRKTRSREDKRDDGHRQPAGGEAEAASGGEASGRAATGAL